MNIRGNKDQSLHKKIQSIFARAKMPTNPKIAAEILNLANDPDSTAEQFASIIKADAALAARLMKMGNSAHFATRNPVTTIQRAVTVLGLRRIRMAAVSFQLVSHLDRLGKVSFDLTKFWQQSVLRACLARELAKRVVPGLAEEAFLVGLLQDSGILLLVQILGREYAEAFDEGAMSPTAFYAYEQKHFKYNHVEVIEAMAQEWQFPEPVSRPLALHHKIIRLAGKSSDINRLCAVSYFVGSVQMAGGQESSPTEPRLLEYANQELKVDEKDLDDIFKNAIKAYHDVSEFFGTVLSDDIDVTDLLQEANRQLSMVADDSDQRIQEAEVERNKFQEERITLQSAVAQYREKAARDPLTGLLNRGALMELSITCLGEAESTERPISVFFLDIDDFKQLNDVHGHQIGDEVLKKVAGIVSETVCNAGLVGRYGGEEFVVVIPGLAKDDAHRHGEMIVDALRSADYSELPLTKPVTCSLGAVWCPWKPSVKALIKRSDQLMYDAKRAGKDRCMFGTMHEDEWAQRPKETNDPSVSGTKDSSPAMPSLANLTELCDLANRINQAEQAECVDVRKQQRRLVSLPCELFLIKGKDLEVSREEACVRSVSLGGMGLLVNRPIVRGDLIEIALTKNDEQLYAAGLVAFCRHIDGEIHEIGVQLINHAKQPIISHNPEEAIRQNDWIARVIEERYGDADELKRSA